MCYQECALYGDLVLWLRDRAAELLADNPNGVGAQRERLDALIHDWFFAPQDNLYGCAPRDVIWAEQLGQPNPIHAEYVDDFFDDDCPICRAGKEEMRAALEAGEQPAWRWHFDDGGFPLIARYDPEGWDARWTEEEADWEAQREEEQGPPAAPGYELPPVEPRQMDPQTFLEFLRHPWLDPALHQAAQKLAEHCDVPVPDARSGLRYRRVTQDEAASLAAGLSRQGVDVRALLDQIDAWPYQNVALDWLSEPEQNVALLCQVLEQELPPQDQDGQTRLRQHRDFILSLTRVVPPAARLWLGGWLEAVAHGAFSGPEGRPQE
jgi:hypothetical protein